VLLRAAACCCVLLQKSIMPFKNKIILKPSPTVRFFLENFREKRKRVCLAVTARR